MVQCMHTSSQRKTSRTRTVHLNDKVTVSFAGYSARKLCPVQWRGRRDHGGSFALGVGLQKLVFDVIVWLFKGESYRVPSCTGTLLLSLYGTESIPWPGFCSGVPHCTSAGGTSRLRTRTHGASSGAVHVKRWRRTCAAQMHAVWHGAPAVLDLPPQGGGGGWSTAQTRRSHTGCAADASHMAKADDASVATWEIGPAHMHAVRYVSVAAFEAAGG